LSPLTNKFVKVNSTSFGVGAAEWDDQCPDPKKKSEEQCSIYEQKMMRIKKIRFIDEVRNDYNFTVLMLGLNLKMIIRIPNDLMEKRLKKKSIFFNLVLQWVL